MYNQITLVGNLTRDIEVRYAQSGTAIANTGIATSKKFKTQSGEQKEEVMFIDITFFGRSAEIANQYLKKGSKVLIAGELKLDQWTDQQGQKKSKHSVTVKEMKMLGSKDDSKQNNAPQQNNESQYGHAQTNPPQQTQYQQAPQMPVIDVGEDEIPF
ncbi:MAG: single-stranded DNA-binding protein [Sulfurimonas sp.]|nr:single-stranded DNA-binding protein [Sulfurimonas sp.]